MNLCVYTEYRPSNKNDTTKGLRLDNDWFGRFNVNRVTGNAAESKEENEYIDEQAVAQKLLEKSLSIISNVLGNEYSKETGLKMIADCDGDLFLLLSKLNQ